MPVVNIATLPPTQSYSLHGYVTEAEKLRKASKDASQLYNRVKDIERRNHVGAIHASVFHFLVAGEHKEQEHCVRISPHYDHVDGMDAFLVEAYSDIDSAMGKGSAIGFRHRASIFPVGLFKETLTKTVNWTHKIVMGGTEYQIEMHKIPNAALVKIEDRHISRLVLPGLYTLEMASNPEARKVPKEILEEIYDIMRETICQVQPSEEAHWPPNYDAEITRQTRVGKAPPGTSTYLISEQHLTPWSEQVLRKVQARPWGNSAFWFDQFRGLRASNVTTGSPLPESVDELFARLNLQVMPGSLNFTQWRFDFATEFLWDQRVMLWRQDAVPFLMSKLLLLSDADAEAVGETSAFHWDSAAQMEEAGGFRYSPSARDQDRSGIHYVQAYCTEKTLTYQLSKHSNSLGLTFPEVVKNGGDDYCTQVGKILSDAAESGAGFAGRLEIRLSGTDFTAAQRLVFTEDEIAKSLFAFDKRLWFQFKAQRLFALGDLLYRWFQADDIEVRATPESVHLVLACIWAINALNNRPKDMSSERALAASLCPHQVESGRSRPVFNHYGVFFFAKLTFHMARNAGVPFLPLDSLDPEALQRIAGNDMTITGQSLECTLRRQKQKRPDAPHSTLAARPSKRSHTANRTNNKVAAPTVSLVPEDHENPFDLDSKNIAWSGRESLDSTVHKLYLQFLKDVSHKLPNHKGPIPYCRPDKTQMLRSQFCTMFKRSNIADVFQVCAFAPAKDEFWRTTLKAFWPESPKDQACRGAQNWDQFLYRKSWLKLRSQLSDGDWDVVRDQVLNVCDQQLTWLPKTFNDRAWSTKQREMTGGTVCYSDSGCYESACPILVTNPNMAPEPLFDASTVTDMDAW